MDYEKLVTIDADDLENEFIKQPNLYLQISTALSQINKEQDLATEEIKFVRATESNKVRCVNEQLGVKAPTAQFLEDALNGDNNLHRLEVERIDLKEKSAHLFGILKALEHKKESMKALSWITFKNSEDT